MKNTIVSVTIAGLKGLTFVGLLALVFAGSDALAQGQWSLLSPTSNPSKRCEHDMAPFGSEIILFGGADTKNGPKYEDTWSWDGNNWTPLSPIDNPPKRAAHTMCYDPNRNKIVLFSGWNGGSYIPDTWEYDGSNWIQMTPLNQPNARDWADMVYDPISKKVILYGGHDYQLPSPYKYDDTWVWDGIDWTQLSPTDNPGKRAGHCMVYDKNRQKVIVYGGYAPGGDTMWEWDGSNWLEIKPTTLPSDAGWSSMVFDDARNLVVYYGGKDNTTTLLTNAVWEWDGNDWTMADNTGPAMSATPAAYDTTTVVDDTTWLYEGPGSALVTDVDQLSASTGGVAKLSLSAGSANASRNYLILGSVSGTSPGIPLPKGVVLPVNWDIFTGLVIDNLFSTLFMNFLGVLDGSGKASAAFNMPPVSGIVGLKFYYAFALAKPWNYASNPVEIEVTP